MVARVTQAKLHLDQAEAATEMWNSTVLPALERRPGFQGAQVLIAGDRGIAVFLFDTHANADAAGADEAVVAAGEKFAPFFADPPERELMDVVVDQGR